MNHQENCGIHHKMCAFPRECLIEHLRAKLETNRDEHYRREEKVLAELAETSAKLAAETARADYAERMEDEMQSAVYEETARADAAEMDRNQARLIAERARSAADLAWVELHQRDMGWVGEVARLRAALETAERDTVISFLDFLGRRGWSIGDLKTGEPCGFHAPDLFREWRGDHDE